MFIYDIGYYSHEESSYTQLTHDKKYNHDDLKKIMTKAIALYFKKYRKEGSHFLNPTKAYNLLKENYQNFLGKYCFDSLQDFYDYELIKILESDFGFKRIKVEESFYFDGWEHVQGRFKSKKIDDEDTLFLVENIRKFIPGYEKEWDELPDDEDELTIMELREDILKDHPDLKEIAEKAREKYGR